MNSISSKARPSPTIPPAISKQLVATARARGTAKATTKRVPPEAAEAISEALRLFISEAHRRAAIEAECDDEGEFRSMNETKYNSQTPIDAQHVTRIAGDLLMDFS
uniref:Centromere protein X n=1 Tax=Pseudo-nitzschia delicatissima TaxID=44447 RepID=A0A7S0ULK2_9STRA|mmetsp:Transcript_4375/g.9125  ORF Transcript_4375/g.9125 Transcript_4375/m.9125 type:complete len:106 (+) Transcript_4375:49-366(+)